MLRYNFFENGHIAAMGKVLVNQPVFPLELKHLSEVFELFFRFNKLSHQISVSPLEYGDQSKKIKDPFLAINNLWSTTEEIELLLFRTFTV